jgi:2-polyprenyl-6-hydroxyphenyl methylase/3-demethylubiquinone-9 3-methyltransferase
MLSMQAQPCSTAASFPTGPGFWRSALHKLIRVQTEWSRRFDELHPAQCRLDGNRDFLDNVVPAYLKRASVVYDIGGGKNPVISSQTKCELSLTLIGLDIDTRELAFAPAGLYDRTICADITSFSGTGNADLVICQALLEHVSDTDRALAGIARTLTSGGRALLFVPSRNAVYARLNLLLPEWLKRAILFGIYPEMTGDHGFPAYYDRCTPAALEGIARRHGLKVESRRLYFHSDYFRFCLPFHALWRGWAILFRAVAGPSASAETFTLVLRKESPAD